MKYKLIKQEPFCCVPRCLQMIFERHGLLYDTQLEMAKELGYRNDEYYKGTQVQKKEYSIEKYLLKHNLPLEFIYIFNLEYNEVKELLNIYKDDDIIVCFKRGVMYGKDMTGGHVAIIEDINNDIVTLIYPEDKEGYRKVTLSSLLNAIELHGKENMAGFWIFKSIS